MFHLSLNASLNQSDLIFVLVFPKMYESLPARFIYWFAYTIVNWMPQIFPTFLAPDLRFCIYLYLYIIIRGYQTQSFWKKTVDSSLVASPITLYASVPCHMSWTPPLLRRPSVPATWPFTLEGTDPEVAALDHRESTWISLCRPNANFCPIGQFRFSVSVSVFVSVSVSGRD